MIFDFRGFFDAEPNIFEFFTEATSSPEEDNMAVNARLSAPIAVSSSGNNVIVAAATGVIVRVIGYHVALSASGTPVVFKFRSASTDITGAVNLPDGGDGSYGFTPPVNGACVCQTAVGEALNLNLSGAVAVGGWIVYERISQTP